MSKMLYTAAAVIALSLGFAAMGSAPGHATNYHVYDHTRPGWVSSWTSQGVRP